jgi:hypothetical protein
MAFLIKRLFKAREKTEARAKKIPGLKNDLREKCSSMLTKSPLIKMKTISGIWVGFNDSSRNNDASKTLMIARKLKRGEKTETSIFDMAR